jgi:exosome complex exonuclease RRP6
VDVEHSQKTYEGITCLIQLSTRHKDYIVDVLAIWKHVHQLKEVMENPDVLKVMHGADMDTVWLQRDYNIHIVNLFDTHKAARYLGKTNFSYGYLLQHYCTVTTDKKYQRADWTLRPLTPEMLLYARMDTHYLL